MLGHEPEIARLLHREHTERLTRAARRPATPAPGPAAQKLARRKRRIGLAHLHLRARV
jgi:hypothetical protein